MNIVITLNANYIKPLCVILRSLLDVHPAPHALSLGKISVETIPESTCIIHYCGKHKPWHEDYRSECGVSFRIKHVNVFNKIQQTSHTK